MTGYLGTVTYANYKGRSKKLFLRPDAAADLATIMEKRPTDPEDLERWKLLPVFRKRGSDKPWDKGSYRKMWKATHDAIVKKHPRLRGMWLRDLRKAAITHMREAGIDRAVAAEIASHSVSMSDHYMTPTKAARTRAVLALGFTAELLPVTGATKVTEQSA